MRINAAFFLDLKYMIETLIDQSIERFIDYCGKEENLEVLHQRIVMPFLKHITVRFSWIILSVQFMTALVLLQTVLLLIIFIRMGCIGGINS